MDHSLFLQSYLNQNSMIINQNCLSYLFSLLYILTNLNTTGILIKKGLAIFSQDLCFPQADFLEPTNYKDWKEDNPKNYVRSTL